MRVLTRLAEIREALKRRVRQAEGCGQGGRSRQGTSRRSAPKARGCCRLARRRARCVRGGRGCGGICSAVRRRRLLAIEQRSPTSDPRATACACVCVCVHACPRVACGPLLARLGGPGHGQLALPAGKPAAGAKLSLPCWSGACAARFTAAAHTPASRTTPPACLARLPFGLQALAQSHRREQGG